MWTVQYYLGRYFRPLRVWRHELKPWCEIEKCHFSLYVICLFPELMKPLFVCWTMIIEPFLIETLWILRGGCTHRSRNVFAPLTEVSSSLYFGQSAIGRKKPHLQQRQPTMPLVLFSFILIRSVPVAVAGWGSLAAGKTSWNISGHAFFFVLPSVFRAEV